jgi:hypothetical protein
MQVEYPKFSQPETVAGPADHQQRMKSATRLFKSEDSSIRELRKRLGISHGQKN